MSQNELVLAALKARKQDGITALEALQAVGTMRLSARVYDLRRQGYKITSHPYRTVPGERTRVALYVLEDA